MSLIQVLISFIVRGKFLINRAFLLDFEKAILHFLFIWHTDGGVNARVKMIFMLYRANNTSRLTLHLQYLKL